MTKLIVAFLIVFILVVAVLITAFYITGNMSVFFISTWIPTLSAVIALLVIRQRAELKTLLGSIRFNAGLLRALPMLLLTAALVTAALIVFIKVFGLQSPYSLKQAFINIPLMLFTGALGEELGWRGVFLKQMLIKTNFIIAAIVMGALWAASHLPLWLMPELESMGYAGNPFLLFTAALIGGSFIYTWVYAYSGGNLLACVLLHFIQNYLLAYTINLNTESSNFFAVYTVINLVLAIIIVVNWRKVEKKKLILFE